MSAVHISAGGVASTSTANTWTGPACVVRTPAGRRDTGLRGHDDEPHRARWTRRAPPSRTTTARAPSGPPSSGPEKDTPAGSGALVQEPSGAGRALPAEVERLTV